MIYEFLEDVVVQIVLITFFVLSMILVLEYVNVLTEGHVHNFMNRNSKLQIVIAALLGLLPGCIGSYTAVSLYTHNVIGFGALLANLIATTGDEAFMMVSLIPSKALIIFAILLVLSLSAGYIAQIMEKSGSKKLLQESHFVLHHTHDQHHQHSLRSNIKENFRNITPHRLILILSITTFIVLTLCGFLNEHHHDGNDDEGIFSPVTTSFIILSGLSLYVVIRVPIHFLEDHIWHHVIGKHFLKVLTWTSVALTIIFIIDNVVDIETWVKQFSSGHVYFFCLLAAILIGMIPESGPHIVFITLYCSGVMPFGALLANSIVQDGHGAIPLFAESKRDFIVVKGIKVAMATAMGAIFWLIA